MPAGTQRAASSEPGIAIGCLVLALAVVPQIAWLVRGYDQVHNLELAVWGFFVSGLLLLSHRFESKSFIFRGIMAVFRRFHVPPRGPWLAFVYSAAFALLGLRYLWLYIRNGV